jgi:hypothetical protein
VASCLCVRPLRWFEPVKGPEVRMGNKLPILPAPSSVLGRQPSVLGPLSSGLSFVVSRDEEAVGISHPTHLNAPVVTGCQPFSGLSLVTSRPVDYNLRAGPFIWLECRGTAWAKAHSAVTRMAAAGLEFGRFGVSSLFRISRFGLRISRPRRAGRGR